MQVAEALPPFRDVAIFVPCNSLARWTIQRLTSSVVVEQRLWRDYRGWYDECLDEVGQYGEADDLEFGDH
ncbi:hypothetical protein OBBRIDRAFT_348041 [Obba rivulosa]|uniref:Uncharacterized protein n=1 Tax=Obba rivulosa TaxID=1052685 RepID=A0A8E2AMI7_9APHY|nr:hypothetical protein OBBRIDRAFT_348041 [Obba rivulosa]